MDLKFYLNKIVKIDNIENYSLNSLYTLKKCYNEFLEKSEGRDPDYPMMSFGDSKNTFKSENNLTQLDLREEAMDSNNVRDPYEL